MIQYIYEDDVIRWYAPSEQVGNWIPNTEKRLQMLKEDTPFYLQTLNIRGDNNFQTVFSRRAMICSDVLLIFICREGNWMRPAKTL